MIENVKILINTPYRELINSDKVLILLKTYSVLFNGCAPPHTCEQHLINYYNTIINKGMDIALLYEAAKKRTCQPAFTSIKYIRQLGKHINPALLTDTDAIAYLSKGYLTKSDFIKLPEAIAEAKKTIASKKTKK